MHHVIEAEAGKLSKPECRLHPLIYGVRFVGGRVVPTESIQVPDRLSAGSPIRWIEASDLSDWAERRDGQDGLPELLSQLILATSGHTATVHFPSGDSVQFAGWDGRTDGGTVMNQPLLFDQLANAPYRNPLSIALRAFVSKAAARGTIAQRSWLMRPRGFAGELGALTGRDCAHSLTGTGSLLAWQLWRSTTLENEGGPRGECAVTVMRTSAAPRISRRSAISAIFGVCIADWRPRPAKAQEAAQVRIQLDQQALDVVPGGERAGLEVTEDTSPSAEGLKARSQPGKAVPIIYLIVGILSIPSVWSAVQEMLRRHEYGGVVIDTRTSPANIRHDQSVQADLVLVIRADGSTESVRSTLATEDFLKGVLSGHGG